MKLRKELWFGFSLMAAILIPVIVLMPWGHLTNGHLGLMMLALICVGIMLGFPTAFTLMGMGVFFAWLAYHSVDPATADRRVLDLFVQRTYGVMSNDVLIAIPLFLFMGYLVERAQLIDKLFKSLHLASARVPGALAVATIVTCAIFATATGIVGAVAHEEAVAGALFEDELALVGVGFAVDVEGVELAGAAGNLFENHLDGLIRWNRVLADFAEEGVIPLGARHYPLRLPVLVLVLHDHAQSGVANSLFGRTQDPDPGLIHFNDGIHALSRAEQDAVYLLRNRHQIAIIPNNWKWFPAKAKRRISIAVPVGRMRSPRRACQLIPLWRLPLRFGSKIRSII